MQVRLDDEAGELVRAEQAANGGSLAAAANRLLLATRAASTPDTARSRGTGATTVVGAPTSRRRPPRARTSTPAPASRSSSDRVRNCPHPLLRRVGDKCMQCGNTVKG